ncbi:pyridoxal phosphate-dependent aminotransferase family protein [Francisella sp. 19X1-34]|uniref:aminotransferase class I/II-fold pyridoxal phosphate-dependent enzyme n=1 Tax=Francisella sp. 19X1-34 TaxID=3087177 RepID=UPI002E307FE0|nr:pyridoxal phosphate-dependent aminotransferase family protein [Francisella sp. 19X1-34]MED7788721.1 pyridoxal phosphate-dependent aminotransferase family protein [Francisella sp. 19X1-34]
MLDLENKYLQYQKDNLLRELKVSNNTDKSIIDFTTSDYLNLSSSINLKQSLIDGFDKYGFGSKGSNIVCGYTNETEEFETTFAKFVNYPRAIFFCSGFMANLAIYSTLFDKSQTIFADKYIHASIIDGIKLSQAKLKRYKHQNSDHLENIYNNKSYITTEGIFSTYGTASQLDKISNIAKGRLIVDEAHSFGVLGKYGKGSIDKYKLRYIDCPISIFPLGKAFGGVGAIVCTTDRIAEYLIQFARNYIYTTALPPLILKTSILQLENLKSADNQRIALYKNIDLFNQLCKEKKLELLSDDVSPIKSILIKNNSLAISLRDKLYTKNILVSCFRYPTVPKKQALLRFSLHANNTPNQIQKALELISKEVNYGFIQ